MHAGHRSLLVGLFTLIAVAGCDINSPWGSSSSGTAYGATSVTGNSGTGTATGGATSPKGGVGAEAGTTGSDDTVVATASNPSVSAAVGASQTVSITFTSSDGLAISGFGVSGTLGSLPAGWSGPATFSCKLVMAGSGCVLNLTYAPTAADSGSLAVNYVYVDNAGLSKAPGGTVTIAYQAIAQNNVAASAAPSGEIDAVLGRGSQSVSVNFTADTSNAALDDAVTNLTLTTDLTALPAGWSSSSSSFSCAIVTTGSGCQLMLSYAPSAAARGTLALNYSYVDDSGSARTGTLNIPYATTASDNVVAVTSPAAQIVAVEKTGSQSVAVDFTTDDGGAASGLVLTSSLTALPAGWHSAASSFSCASVSTGNGCRLALDFAPTALGAGTLSLTYAYTDAAGTAQTGTLDVPYAATTDDNVVATAAPSGQINAVVGQGAQNVGIAFTTDDARLATALAVTGGLATLPPGWSGPSGFSCTSVSTGSACQLGLSYTPAAYTAPGTLTINYGYTDNAGQAKTGSVDVPYRATTDDAVVGTPSATPLTVILGTPTAVTITFATNDGYPAIGVPSTSNALSVTSGLDSLPPGWSAAATSFSCLTVSDGTPCQLTLTYTPTAVSGGLQTLTIGYSYVNDAGMASTGTASIAYQAVSNNTVGTSIAPSSTLSVATGSSTPVTIGFTTSDGNPASSLSVSGLSSLPAGWSGPATFTCAGVNGTAASCELTLTYAPSSPGSGTLTLDYGYLNDAGQPMSGSATIQYGAT